MKLEIPAHRIPDWGMDEHQLCAELPKNPKDVDSLEEQIEMIPMGAARLRLSVFPHIHDDLPDDE